jgi:mRNA-degrading endonuclease RelE of RelBE toxin-antitoxin system
VTGPDPYSIERIAPRAANYLRRLPRDQQEAIAEALDYLCNTSPFHHSNPTVIRPLKGKYKGQWRYCMGKIRIVYSVNNDSRTIRISAIDNRGDVY